MTEHSLNIRVQQSLTSQTRLQHQISHKQWKVNYYEQMNTYIESILTDIHKQSKQKKIMKSLMGVLGKLKQLEKQAVCWKTGVTTNKQQKIVDNEKQCRVSTHIKYILGNNAEQTKQNITKLIKQKQEILKNINKQLQNDEPYIHEKIENKIVREMKRQGKIQVIKQLQAIIKDKKGWLNKKQQKIGHDHNQQKLQQQVANNFQKMKQILTKKLTIDEQLKECTSNSSMIDKKLDSRVRNSVAVLKHKIQQDQQYIQELQLEDQLDDIASKKTMTTKDSKQRQKSTGDTLLTQKQMLQIREMSEEILQCLGSALGGENVEQIQEDVQKLEQRINLYQKM